MAVERFKVSPAGTSISMEERVPKSFPYPCTPSPSPFKPRQVRFTSPCPATPSLELSFGSASPVLPGSRKLRVQKRQISFQSMPSVLVLVALVFCIGWKTNELCGSSNIRQEIRVSSQDIARDLFMENQEILLLDLAKSQDLSDENKVLLEHVDLLQNELKEKDAALHFESRRRLVEEARAIDLLKKNEQLTLQKTDRKRESQRDVERLLATIGEQRFGTGPHYVEFEVVIDQENPISEFFTVEVAPLYAMPATVYAFLSQVEQDLWSGTSFYLNAPHIIGAHTRSANANHDTFAKMEERGIARALAEERNSNWSHVEYTLGYHRSGPNWFINKMNNVQSHQDDPCFAKVVIGRQVVDMIGEVLGPEGDLYFIQPVEIRKVRLVSDLSMVVGGHEFLEHEENDVEAAEQRTKSEI